MLDTADLANEPVEGYAPNTAPARFAAAKPNNNGTHNLVQNWLEAVDLLARGQVSSS